MGEEKIDKIMATICCILMIVVVIVCIQLDEKDRIRQEKIKQNIIEQQKVCNHEYVITSKYNFLVGKYKTISKCTKCAKVVE